MKELFTGLLIFAGILGLIAIYKNWDRIFPPKEPLVDSNEITCELRDPKGNVIKITGIEGDTQFERMCTQSTTNQPVYVYPYYYVRQYRHRWYKKPATPPTPTP